MKRLYPLILFLFLISCAKDIATEDVRKFNSENEWIYSVMKNNYLYRSDMSKNPNFSKSPVDFFYSLLSDRDGSIHSKPFSYIEERHKTRTLSSNTIPGIKFSTYRLINDEIYFARVLYCLPNSSFSASGLKRGDYILQINNKPLNNNNVSLLKSGESIELTVIRNRDVSYQDLLHPVSTSKITVAKSEMTYDNPIFSHKTIEQNGKKIGYLIYNHFTSGIGEDSSIDKRYNDELCQISNIFASDNITEFILDLRYNGGGELDAAQVLSTLLAPQDALNNIFCILEDANGNTSIRYKLDPNRIRNGQNLNLRRLFVLTSNFSASASELIINSLRPYMDVIIVGETTVGKNVASTPYKHEKYAHKLHPITYYVYNKEMKADYSKGFTPDREVDDFILDRKIFELGDQFNEPLLKSALSIINGRALKTKETKSSNDILYRRMPSKENTDLVI